MNLAVCRLDRVDDFRGALVQHAMIVRFHSDADYFIRPSHKTPTKFDGLDNFLVRRKHEGIVSTLGRQFLIESFREKIVIVRIKRCFQFCLLGDFSLFLNRFTV